MTSRVLTLHEHLATEPTAAGCTNTSAAGLIATTHPLFTRTGRNRYRVLESPEHRR